MEENIENIEDKNIEMIVRRLTPAECERLQGFPDNWTLIGKPKEKWVKNKNIVVDEVEVDDDLFAKVIEKHEEERPGYHKETAYFYLDASGKETEATDSKRYKALGNSIALPQWWWIVSKMKKYLNENATLGSLFDGISGFPLVWETAYGAHTTKWTSEIEPFPEAVCTQHFGDEDRGIKGDLYD